MTVKDVTTVIFDSNHESVPEISTVDLVVPMISSDREKYILSTTLTEKPSMEIEWSLGISLLGGFKGNNAKDGPPPKSLKQYGISAFWKPVVQPLEEETIQRQTSPLTESPDIDPINDAVDQLVSLHSGSSTEEPGNSQRDDHPESIHISSELIPEPVIVDAKRK